LARTTYNDVLRVGVCSEMRPVGMAKKRKRAETFMRQTGYLPRPPTSTYPPEILHTGSYPGDSYIFQVLWKSVEGSRSCDGSKIALSHWLGPWLIQQLVLPYKPWSNKQTLKHIAPLIAKNEIPYGWGDSGVIPLTLATAAVLRVYRVAAM